MDIAMFILLILVSVAGVIVYKKLIPTQFKEYLVWAIFIDALGLIFLLYRCRIL